MSLGNGISTLAKYLNTASANTIKNLGLNTSTNGYVRIQQKNRSVETSPGIYSWSAMDAAVNYFVGSGLKIILTLEGFASWWLDPTCGLPTAAGMQSWGYQVINRYGSEISGVEMGNEEFSFVSGSCRAASIYYGVISNAYTYLKSLHSGLTIGSGAYTNYSGQAGTNGDPAYWFGQLFGLGAASYMDYANIHYYNGGIDPDQNNPMGAPALLTIIGDINIAAANAGKSNLPIRVTEFGWQGKGSQGGVSCPNNVGATLQTTYIQKALTELAGATNVDAAFLYTCGADQAGFYDCHDIDGLSTYSAMQNFYQGSSPVQPVTIYLPLMRW